MLKVLFFISITILCSGCVGVNYQSDKSWRFDRLKENSNYNFNEHNNYMLETYGATNVLVEPKD